MSEIFQCDIEKEERLTFVRGKRVRGEDKRARHTHAIPTHRGNANNEHDG